MYSIHFHIQMLDKKQFQPTSATIPTVVDSTLCTNLHAASHTLQHPHLISPIDNKHDSNDSPAFPAAH